MTAIADHLRAHLAKTGKSMRALSLDAGLHAKAVSEIVSGVVKRPRAAVLEALSPIVGVDLAAIPVQRDTMADEILGWLSGDRLAHWSKAQRSGARSALALYVKTISPGGATMCRFDRAGVRKFLTTHSPAALGIGPNTFSAYASHLNALCDLVEAHQRPPSIRDVVGPWRDLFDAVKQAVEAGKLAESVTFVAGPFFAWAHANGVAVHEVHGGTFVQYRDDRIAHGKATATEAKHLHVARECLSVWNRLAATPSFGAFGVRPAENPFSDGRDKYGMPAYLLAPLLAEFDGCVLPWARGETTPDGVPVSEALDAMAPVSQPPSSPKLAKAAAFVGSRARVDERTREERLKAAGILLSGATWKATTADRTRAGVISLAKTLWAATGVVIESIAELTDPHMLEAAATALDEACDQDDYESSYVEFLLKRVKKIARDFCRRDASEIEKINALIADFSLNHAGIAPRNMAKLQQFTEERIHRFVTMSADIVDEVNAEIARRKRAAARKGRELEMRDLLDDRMARLLEIAVAHDILLARAPRIGNVLAIDLPAHVRDDANGHVVIELPKEIVKNKQALTIPLGEAETKLFRTYVARVRPLLISKVNAGATLLFPARRSSEGHYTGLRKGLIDEIHARVGARIHPHLYRHLVGWIWLRRDLGALPKVQKLLGHKRLETTMQFYAELDSSLCTQEWADILEEIRNERPGNETGGRDCGRRGAKRRQAA